MVQKQSACECVCVYHMCAFMGVGGNDGTNVCFNSVKKIQEWFHNSEDKSVQIYFHSNCDS
jgi:hypothetical protein